jgi:anaerobic selenocysteine-containing dehydrogenase
VTTTEKITFCRICEPLCGLVATVEDGRITAVRGDKENPLSQGFQCVKSEAMVDVVYDTDRVLGPLRRNPSGDGFTSTGWEQAQADIAERLGRIIAEHGPESVAVFHGNPPAFGYAAMLALEGFQRAIGTPYKYGVNAEDGASRMAASALLYGTPTFFFRPDFWRTDFALVIGSNLYVSHGSFLTEPQIRSALKGIVERGGRVVVIDPRRTETAKQFEHLPIRAGTDGWLMAAIIRELLTLPIKDQAFLDRHVTGLDRLRQAAEPFTPERAEDITGIPAATVAALARDLHAARSAAVHGRTGTCTQQFGTLVNVLQDLVCVVTGNVDRPGGMVCSWAPIDFSRFAELAGMATYGKVHTIVRGLPEVIGMLPSQGLAEDIATDRPDRIRALVMLGGNPVLSSGGGGPRLEAALEKLELFVTLDLYVTETTKHAHYILPTPTWYEREDVPLAFMGMMLRPTVMATEAVIDRIGDTKEEWEILDDLAHRMGRGGAYFLSIQRRLAKLGFRPKPRTLVDLMLRTSRAGDFFGLRRGGISWSKLLSRHPHGRQLKAELPTGVFTAKLLRTPDARIQAAADPFLDELAAMDRAAPFDGYPLRAHGMRELRSHNTWLHNSERLMPDSRRYAALMNPADAEAAGIADGSDIVVTSPEGRIRVPVKLTTDESPGNIALPHGWGHDGGWQRANRAGGANSNLLVSTEDKGIERLAAMSVLNGIPVRVEPAGDES